MDTCVVLYFQALTAMCEFINIHLSNWWMKMFLQKNLFITPATYCNAALGCVSQTDDVVFLKYA